MRYNACFWILADPNEEPSLLVLAAINNGFGACRRIQRLSRRLVYSTLKNVQILLELYFVQTNVSHISYLYKYHRSYNVAIVSSVQTNVSPTYCRQLNVGNEQINKTHHTSFPKNISR